ncbi:aldehyde dehydrogenase family protein [Enterobacter sp. Ap-1006]|uniref:aldehyde dehydrogenase family protein n=1 Tax=Enterobacter sp. Ap-1006 TaxID=2608345 RepID=UPI00142495D1|nr:aldehyde dehydrogenase family protein [Enterobacter sp. Ap-1006]NIF47484.1 aldehyde dehydrogenase family protein [Enterobacter sp. Ap-1006]
MKTIDTLYINGQHVTPHGTEVLTLIHPVSEQPVAQVRLADEEDTRLAIAAAKAAFPQMRLSSREQRMIWLQLLHDAVKAREDELVETMVDEYGCPVAFAQSTVARSYNSFLQAIDLLKDYAFESQAGMAKVVMEPLGVVGLITPWNANYGFIAGKLSMVIASGSTAVIKPSELSARQTAIITECLHAAGLPDGVINIVTGLGNVVGAEITRHPDVAKISFTGSTAVGKTIARDGAATMKRVTLELGGKSANVLLDDADLDTAIPLALQVMSWNSGQACIAGTRLLVPESRLAEVKAQILKHLAILVPGNPRDPKTNIGAAVTARQYQRVQEYIRSGIAEGAELLCGGEGRPEGLASGYFVKPTVFVNVRNDMTIAQQEIFGPVLSVITYRDDAEAVQIANDTVYGLQAYVSGKDTVRTAAVARQLIAGRVFVNGVYDEPLAPFGGFKQSGLGREFGTYGLEAYLEPKAIMGQ